MILVIVYLILEKVGVVTFIAAGISFVYQVEQLPLAIATIIQMAVLYFDYLLFYRLNGWVPNEG